MEQLHLEVTQSLLRERHAQVVRDAETRRMLRERAALASSTAAQHGAAAAAGAVAAPTAPAALLPRHARASRIAARLAVALHLHRRPAVA